MPMMIGISAGDIVLNESNFLEQNNKCDKSLVISAGENNIDTIIEVLSIKQRQNISNISDEEANKIYAAIKLIENLYKQNLIKEHVFKNIVKEYSNCVVSFIHIAYIGICAKDNLYTSVDSAKPVCRILCRI